WFEDIFPELHGIDLSRHSSTYRPYTNGWPRQRNETIGAWCNGRGNDSLGHAGLVLACKRPDGDLQKSLDVGILEPKSSWPCQTNAHEAFAGIFSDNDIAFGKSADVEFAVGCDNSHLVSNQHENRSLIALCTL